MHPAAIELKLRNTHGSTAENRKVTLRSTWH